MSDESPSATIPPKSELFHVFVVSDGTGETVENTVRATLKQFDDSRVKVTRYKNIRNREQAEAIIEEAERKNAVLIFTVVSDEVRNALKTAPERHKVKAIDLFGPMIDIFVEHLGTPSKSEPGLLHQVNEAYFRRIEAMEFTVKHDDGSNVENLNRSDIVLVGVSRTSKTPLSIYLSHKGFKVANVPLVKGIEPPQSLFQVDQTKIIALTINPEHLAKIRRERLVRMGRDPAGDYASIQHIHEEIEWARSLFARNRRWPVFDVTNKALEETASEIEKIVNSKMRMR